MNYDLEIKKGKKVEELINEIKSKSGKRVKKHIEHSRFPYTYSCDLERLGDGSRSDTSALLGEKFNDDIDGYAKEIISRAFTYLLKNYGEDFLWDVLDEKDNNVVRDVYIFIRDNYHINMNI